jgi:hypothetical protein
MNIIKLCKAGKSKKVLELLKHPDKCTLDCVDSKGYTALIHACKNKMKK